MAELQQQCKANISGYL